MPVLLVFGAYEILHWLSTPDFVDAQWLLLADSVEQSRRDFCP